MGTRLSIDKHVSSLDELLDMSPQYFNRVKFESKISPIITQHMKVWRFLFNFHHLHLLCLILCFEPLCVDLALLRGQVKV